jgi:hypothetical protein
VGRTGLDSGVGLMDALTQAEDITTTRIRMIINSFFII